MKKYYLVLLIIFALFYSCKSENFNNKKNIEIIKQIEFNTNYNVRPKFAGNYYDNIINQEVIYLADPQTKKCIKTFSTEGIIIDSIPLSQAINLFDQNNIGSIYPVSRDTIIITSSYSNKIAVINHLGECYYELDIDQILPQQLKYEFEFYSSDISKVISSGDALLYRAWPKFPNVINRLQQNESDIPTQIYHFYSEFYDLPYFLRIKNFMNNDMSVDFGYNFYPNLYDKGEIFDIYNLFKCIDNYIYLFSTNSDTIYKIDKNNFDITDKIKVNSSYTSIGIKPLVINKNPDIYFKDYDDLNSAYINNGVIRNIFFNEKTRNFYVIIRHTVTEEECKQYGDYGIYRPFSIIKYDENFENPHEYNFEGNLYYYDVSIMTNDGIIILKKNKDKNADSYGKQIFDLLKFN